MRAWIVLACCLVSLPAHATTFVALSFEQLVDQSSLIAYGRVIDVRSQWTDDRRFIETTVSFAVIDSLKGGAGETIAFTVPGGQVGRYLNVIPGAPVFTPGDLAVVFLTSRAGRLPITTGLTQGVYRAQREADGQIRVAAPALGSSGRIVRGDTMRRPLSISAFAATVRNAATAR